MVPLPTDRWTRRHLLGLEGLSADEILALLETADAFYPYATGREPAPQVLEGRTVLNLFLEDSTRTRTSFTLAAERLGGRVVQFYAHTSSMRQKGETLLDTARNVEAMGLDALVVRHRERGAPHRLAEAVGCSVLNAGDDAHEHPTQALLDMLALRHHLGRLEGLTVVICGDIRHSRVARSNLYGLRTLGSRVIFVGPPVFLEGLDDVASPVEKATDFDAVLPECDAVMMLRVQLERHEGLDFDREAYIRDYQLTAERLARARPHAPVLHPGPVNRGVELTDEVADGPRSLILHQVTCGVAVRMAALALCIAAADAQARPEDASAPRPERPAPDART